MCLYCRVFVREQAKAIITISRWQCFVGFQLWSPNFHTDRIALGGWYAYVGEGLCDSSGVICACAHTIRIWKWQISVLDSALVSPVLLGWEWWCCWGEPPVQTSPRVSVEELSRVLKQPAVALLAVFKVGKCKVCARVCVNKKPEISIKITCRWEGVQHTCQQHV